MDIDRSMAGWIGFAGIVLVVLGCIDLFQGLIALLNDDYFIVGQSGYLVVDVTAWGWLLLVWGVLLVGVGLGLLAAQDWARWTAIFGVSLNLFAQLGYLGNSGTPLWSLTAVALSITVLYALTVRWGESKAAIESIR